MPPARIRPQKPENPLICDPAAPLDTARTLIRAKKIPRELLTACARWLDGSYPYSPMHQLHAVLWLALDKAVRPNGKPFRPRKSHVNQVLEAIDALLGAKSYYESEEWLRWKLSGKGAA